MTSCSRAKQRRQHWAATTGCARPAPRGATRLLARLPAFATFFAETLVPLDAWATPRDGDEDDDDAGFDAEALDTQADATRRRAQRRQAPTFDLRPLAARQDSAHSLRWGGVLKRAIDAGQDRAVIEAIAQRFAVDDNVVRRVWRDKPAALGQPPTWSGANPAPARRAQRARLRRRGRLESLIASAVPIEAA